LWRDLVDGSEGARSDLLAKDELLVVNLSVSVLALVARSLVAKNET
jgi:hypothetical protein